MQYIDFLFCIGTLWYNVNKGNTTLRIYLLANYIFQFKSMACAHNSILAIGCLQSTHTRHNNKHKLHIKRNGRSAIKISPDTVNSCSHSEFQNTANKHHRSTCPGSGRLGEQRWLLLHWKRFVLHKIAKVYVDLTFHNNIFRYLNLQHKQSPIRRHIEICEHLRGQHE